MWLEYVTSRFNTCIDDIYLVSHVKHIFHFLAVDIWILDVMWKLEHFLLSTFLSPREFWFDKGIDLCQRKSGNIHYVIDLSKPFTQEYNPLEKQ